MQTLHMWGQTFICIDNVRTPDSMDDMSTINTTIQVRIDKKTKQQAQAIFKKMGMDLSGAMKIFLSQVVRVKAMPFIVRTENGFTPEYEAELIAETEYAKKHGPRFKTVEALMKDLND